jgi:hypothetical protein
MPRAKKSKMGRPVLGSAGLTRSITLKTSEDLLPQWRKAADAAGLSLGEWLREAAAEMMARAAKR